MTREEIITKVLNLMEQYENTQLGEVFVYLKAGCDFQITEPTTEGFFEIVITHKTFFTMEGGPPREEYIRLKLRKSEPVKTDIKTISRNELLTRCYHSIVPHDKWRDRDSPGAQAQIGELISLLKQKQPYRIRCEANGYVDLLSDQRTLWIECNGETYYLPTLKRLEESQGRDWY